MQLKERCKPFACQVREAQEDGYYPYFRSISSSSGPEVEVGGKKLIMIGSNDYLGLSHDQRVIEKAADAMKRWGTGPGGSRFLNGNLTLHSIAEERLAEFVGKKKAIIHTTGFQANLGAIGCLVGAGDFILYDRENHASIFEGCRASRSRLFPFAHNCVDSAKAQLAKAREKHPNGCSMLITEGVFSMSGDVAPVAGFAEMKRNDPSLLIYLDDAHGLGVMGKEGRGTANHFGAAADVDFIMGTFSKALASIGGFIASDHEEILVYLKHHSKTLIFSAALPASNTATVLACLDVLAEEPERIDRLRTVTRRVRGAYRDIGFCTQDSETPIVPILIGSEEKAYFFARDLFDQGVFALPAIFPAVPKGHAIIRTAYMSTHEDRQIDRVLEVLDRMARRYGVRTCDFEVPGSWSQRIEPLSEHSIA